MSNLPDILCFSSTDWEGKWGSRQQVMMRFAQRGYRILFIERPAGLEHLLRYPTLRQRKLRRWREGLRSIANNLWIASLPPLLPGRYYSVSVNRMNQRLTIHWTKRYLARLRFSPAILWLYNPEQGSLIGQFGCELSVYHCIDEFTAGTKGRKRRIINQLERKLLSEVDLVLANSLLTYENKLRYNANTNRIPSGTDAAHFNKANNPNLSVHPDIAKIPQPVLTYLGNISNRVDVKLLSKIAMDHPEWSLVLIGQAYTQTVDLDQLRQYSNVHFLGKRAFKKLPSLLKGTDVCLIPYVSGEINRYRSPLKLYEYLATGKPIVSTAQPEVGEYSDLVFIAESAAEFERGIQEALMEDSLEAKQKRIQTAKENSWDKRVSEMNKLILKRLSKK